MTEKKRMMSPLMEDEQEYDSPTKAKLKKYGIICGIVLVVFVIGFLIAWFAVIPKVLVHILEQSEIEFDSIKISGWTNNTFNLESKARLKYSSPMPAQLAEATVNIAWGSVPLGTLVFPKLKLPAGNGLSFDMDGPFTISNLEGWDSFGRQLMRQKSLKWKMTSSMTVLLFGAPFSNIPMEKDISIGGLGNFVDPPISIGQPVVKSGSQDQLRIGMGLTIPNPTINTLDLGLVTQQVWYSDQILGTATLQMLLNPGNNTFDSTATIVRTPSNADALKKFLSEFMSGRSTILNIRADTSATPLPLLKATMASMNAFATLPGMSPQVMVKADLSFGLSSLILQMPCKMTMKNNFDIPVRVINGDFTVEVNDTRTKIGTMTAFMNVTVPPRATFTTPEYRVKITDITRGVVAGLVGLRGLFIDVSGIMDVVVDRFTVMAIPYQQKGIQSFFSPLG